MVPIRPPQRRAKAVRRRRPPAPVRAHQGTRTQLETAAHMYERFKHENWEEFVPSRFGFEFSIEEVEEKVAYLEGLRIRCPYPKQYAKYFGAPRLKDERLEKAA